MKLIFSLLFLSAMASAQGINQYKYAIIPLRFEAQKQEHQYGLNELTRKYFEKLGFVVVFDDQPIPQSYSNGCDRLFVDVIGDNSMFRTALKVVLKDCSNQIVHETPVFTNKNKDNHLAYNFALRDALKSIDGLNYKYSSKPNPEPAATVATGDVIMKSDFNSVDPESPLLNAQPIENGFQLVDTTPKIVLRMFKTSQPDVYSASDGTSNGVVFRSGEKWVYEYYESGKRMTRELNIKF